MSNQLELFHNTTCLEGAALRRREIRAGSQNARILDFFRLNRNKSYTPAEIKTFCCFYNAPITSIRRAMTDLTTLGYLVKTEEKRPGEYGELNYCWRLA